MSRIYKEEEREFIAQIKASLLDEFRSNEWQQKKIAKILGISEPRMSDILKDDRNITLKTLFRISNAIGLKPIFTFENND